MHRPPLQEHLEGRAASDKDWFSLHITRGHPRLGLGVCERHESRKLPWLVLRALSRVASLGRSAHVGCSLSGTHAAALDGLLPWSAVLAALAARAAVTS